MSRNSDRLREPWRPTGTVSPLCEVIMGRNTRGLPRTCGGPVEYAYPAMGGGYMALCEMHAQKHLWYCVTYEQACHGELPRMVGQSPAADLTAEVIRRRRALGWSQSQLARAMGLSAPSINRYERIGYSVRRAQQALEIMRQATSGSRRPEQEAAR